MLKIITYPNPILRQKNQLVNDPTDLNIKQLIVEMIKTMRAHDGLGLAAPQVGKNIKLCVVEIDNEVFVLINPEIKKFYGEQKIMEEGCLSFPNKFLPVKRAERIKVKTLNEAGKKITLHAKGLLARAIQHEIDHLNGVLLIDQAENNNDKDEINEIIKTY